MSVVPKSCRCPRRCRHRCRRHRYPAPPAPPWPLTPQYGVGDRRGGVSLEGDAAADAIATGLAAGPGAADCRVPREQAVGKRKAPAVAEDAATDAVASGCALGLVVGDLAARDVQGATVEDAASVDGGVAAYGAGECGLAEGAVVQAAATSGRGIAADRAVGQCGDAAKRISRAVIAIIREALREHSAAALGGVAAHAGVGQHGRGASEAISHQPPPLAVAELPLTVQLESVVLPYPG